MRARAPVCSCRPPRGEEEESGTERSGPPWRLQICRTSAPRAGSLPSPPGIHGGGAQAAQTPHPRLSSQTVIKLRRCGGRVKHGRPHLGVSGAPGPESRCGGAQSRVPACWGLRTPGGVPEPGKGPRVLARSGGLVQPKCPPLGRSRACPPAALSAAADVPVHSAPGPRARRRARRGPARRWVARRSFGPPRAVQPPQAVGLWGN